MINALYFVGKQEDQAKMKELIKNKGLTNDDLLFIVKSWKIGKEWCDGL